MPYTILNNDNTVLLRLADGTFNSTLTSVTFIGRDIAGYGQFYNQNLVTLLTNSAAPNYNPPSNNHTPLKGQLWYDTTYNRLRVYNGAQFVSVASATSGSRTPVGLTQGDFWYDTTNKILNFYNGTNFSTISTYPTGQSAGWIVPINPSSITDNSPAPINQPVTLLNNFGSVVGALSQTTFVASSTSSSNPLVFNAAGKTNLQVVNGLNIFGNISVTGSVISMNERTPTSSTAPGILGQFAWDLNFMYIYTSAGWKRTAALNSF